MADLWERQPIAKSAISIVVTGEGEALRRTLAGVAGAAKGHPYELIVLAAPGREIEFEGIPGRVVSDDAVSRGSGAALRVGIAAAKHPLVFTLPAGYDAGVLPAFLKEIDLVDIVCGARRSKAKGWKLRQFFSVTYQIFGLWLQDPECPVRLYRRQIFERIPIQSDGAFAQVEILAKANFESKLLTEVPIDGPTVDEPRESRDVWRVMKNPNFGPAPERVIEPVMKPLFAKDGSQESGARSPESE